MADYMPGEILIGGPIRADLVPSLCQAITAQGVARDWNDADFFPESGEELLAAREDIQGVLLLHLCDVEASFGQFAELETFLEEHGISFRRRSDAKYEFDAELVEFRPGIGQVRFLTNASGKPFVPLADLAAVATALDQAASAATGESTAELMVQLQEIQRLAKDRLPLAVPPLKTLEIVETNKETSLG
jgi:hypothetical protein